MRKTLVPAEQWDVFAESNSCMSASEQKGKKPVSVKTFEYGGFIYTSFAVMYGAYGIERKPEIYAYKLLPVTMYEGETTTLWHDEDAIYAGLRQRGDSTGLIVSIKGDLAVCVEKVNFEKDLPGTQPVSIEKAKAYNNAPAHQGGWRAHYFRDIQPQWYLLNGHPVAVYESEHHGRIATLFWKQFTAIKEMTIAGDVSLAAITGAMSEPEEKGQLFLF